MPQDSAHYFTPDPTVSPQSVQVSSRVVFRPGYLLIPAGSMVDVVYSTLPYWQKTRAWTLTTPDMSHETSFCFYLMYCEQGGGSAEPKSEPGVEGLLFVMAGQLRLKVGADRHELTKGGFAYIPPDSRWSLLNPSEETLKFIWVRKMYEPIRDSKPKMVIGNEQDLPKAYFSDNLWSRHLIPLDDMAYDMHVNINTFDPGAFIPMVEAHVMQHGLYMLQGQGVYLLNEQWHEVREGDYIWMHAWCPQACYAGGVVPMRYLLYKNMNRQFSLRR